MKELTIEYKAKAYDEAYKKVAVRFGSNVADEIFLKDSELQEVSYYIPEGFHAEIEGNKVIIKKGEQKPAGKVEPKFKVGDKIRKKTPSSFDRDMQVERIEKDYYVCNHIGKLSSEVVPFSKESSYELIEQNPAWSEGDEEMYKEVLTDIIYAKNDLEVKECLGLSKRAMEAFNWFSKRYKSLRPQNRWKPSDEQMDALYTYIYNPQYFNSPDPRMELVESVYKDLKKLREE